MKPVSSAIQASNLNLTPQSDPHNALQLNINLPPPTTESRKAVVEEAGKAADMANAAVKNARGAQQKALRSMQLSKSVRDDDLKKARDQMEKLVQNGAAEVRRIANSARRALESG